MWALPGLIEAATVGVPDSVYGEEVVSYVVARPGAAVDSSELLRSCSERLPAFKAPKQIVLSHSLPKTERGKPNRRALAQRFVGGVLRRLKEGRQGGIQQEIGGDEV